VVLGGCGIINLREWSLGLQLCGLRARTIVWSTPEIYSADTFDRDLKRRYGNFSGVMAPVEFARAVSGHEIIICGFDGFLLGNTCLASVEVALVRISGCKLVVAPYGGDAHILGRLSIEGLRHALQVSYPLIARQQFKIEKRVRRLVAHADAVLPGMSGFDGIGRWDVLAPSFLAIDTDLWRPRLNPPPSSTLRVVHAPNHRGFKGSEFVIRAVERLADQGVDISLRLLEGVDNHEVRRIFSEETDVLVEQLVHVGYAMTAIEGMACGVAVISNLEDQRVVVPMRRWSFLGQCPIISSDPEKIEGTLRELASNRALVRAAGNAGREYVQSYHSREAIGRLLSELARHLTGERGNLLLYFHPILGEVTTVRERNNES
jgi:hypothetical protein